jgi:glycosyltransferase involved in cell wall biosynthesis
VRVLITHDFLETYGGAERVTAEIASAFPEARIFAILGRTSVAERMGVADRVTTILPERSWLLRNYRFLAPVYPAMVRLPRLPEADLVVASSYAYSHAFRTPNRAPVMCYSHGPCRHLWSQQDAYAQRVPGGHVGRAAFAAYQRFGRAADHAAAQTVAHFVTQSPFTADQIAGVYGRQAEILPPPVDCRVFRPSGKPPENYYLFAGRLVEPYKRPTLVVDAFTQMPDLRLRVAGEGPELEELRRRAGPNVEFVGRLEDEDLVAAMQHCQAAIFPSVDDFGLVPVEVNACGRPVLAFGAGGALHTLKPGVSGDFLESQTAEAVIKAVRAHDPARYDPKRIRQHAMCWDSGEFRLKLREAARRTIEHDRGR